MTQSIEYVVKVNATQAQQAVADIEKRFGGVDTVVARVDKSIVALERDMKDLNAAIARGGPNVAQYRAHLEQLRTSLYGAPGAAGRAGGAGGMGVGMAALEASRAIEDLQYGIGGVVNNIPGLVMALGGGAGLTAAISLAAVGVNQLYKQFSAMPDATSAAATAAKTHMQSVVESIAEANDELNRLLVDSARGRIAAQEAAVEQAKVATERARSQFRDQFGINPLDMDAMGRVASQAQGGMDIWVKRWNVQKNQMEQVRVAAKDVMAAYRETTDAYNLAVEEQVLLSKYRAIEAERQKQAEIDAAVDAANAITKAEEAAAKKRADIAKKAGEDRLRLMYVESGDDGAATAREEREQRRREAANERMLNQQLKADEKAAAEAAKTEAERTRILEREARERERIREQEAAHAARLREQEVRHLQMIGSDAAAAIGVFAAQAAMGQEAAFENLVSAASQQAGSLIMLEGGKVMAAGIAGMLTAPNPASAAQIAGGAGLVAAGAAVQQIGPAAVAMLSGKAGAMGGTGATSATRDPGAAPRTSSGGSTSGPMIINVSYGAGGPLPEDVAREIDRVMSSGNRRRGAA